MTPFAASDLNAELLIISVGFQSAKSILSYIPIAPLLIMIVTIVICLGCSASFHLLNVKSPEWNSWLARLDYGGIAFTIFGCNLPIIYYGFAC